MQFTADIEMTDVTSLTQLKFKVKKKTEITNTLKRKQQQQLMNILKEKSDSATVMNKTLEQNISVTMYNLLEISSKLQQLFF